MQSEKYIICHDLGGNKIEVESSKIIYRQSIYGILIENNKILLSRQWDGYDFPDDGTEIYETVEEALKREFIEETGIKIEVLKPVHVETSFFDPSHSKKNKGQYWNCPLIYFLVKKTGGGVSKGNLDEEELEYVDMPEWIDLNSIKKIKFINSVDSVKLINKAVSLI